MSNIIKFPRPPIKETVKPATPKPRARGLWLDCSSAYG